MKWFVIAMTFWLPVTALGQVTVDWVEDTRGVSIAVDAGNNVYTADYDYNPAGDITLTKRDTNGAFLWSAKFDQTDNSKWEKATWVATDSDGNAIVSGTLMSGYSNPVNAASILMKFSPSGQLLWRRIYESAFDGSYTRKCLVGGDDNIYVLGMGSGPSGFVTKIKAFAPDGGALWTWFDAAGIGAPTNFKFTPDGAITVTGRSIFGSINGYAKVDLAGNVIWSHPGVNSLTVGDADGDSFGHTYLVHGEYVVNGGTVIRKISPSGELLWENSYPFAAQRIEVGGDDRPVACGYPNAGSFGAAFLKVDGDGAVVWSNLDADGPLSLLAHAHLVMDQEDNIYLAAGTMFEMAVCKVTSAGTPAWTATTTGSYAYAIALGNDGNVYVVGGSTARLGQASSAGSPVLLDGGADRITLAGCFPNPASTGTTIRYSLREEGEVTLSLFDLAGREVVASRHGVEGPGDRAVSFGLSGLAAGTYFYRLQVGGEVMAAALGVVR